MGNPGIDRDALARELRRVRRVRDPETFLRVLRRSVTTTATAIPAEAREVLLKAGVDTNLIDQPGIEYATLRIAEDTADTRAAARAAAITTQEAAVLLKVSASTIRRNVVAKQIYSLPAGRGGYLLPTWQFISEVPLPHLAEVLAILPDDLHPLEVESFFTASNETLSGMSPAHWLAAGGGLEPILILADDEERR